MSLELDASQRAYMYFLVFLIRIVSTLPTRLYAPICDVTSAACEWDTDNPSGS